MTHFIRPILYKQVLPYCLLNVAISAIAQYLKAYKGIDLDLSDASHSLMNMLVAFLLVTRITMSVNRYNDCRSCLGKMCLEIRELLQNMIVLTRKMKQESDKEWRNETTYRALLLLRTAMAVLDYMSLLKPAWDILELDPDETAELKEDTHTYFQKEPFAGERTEFSETQRVPPIMAFKLRWCLDTSEDRLSAQMKVFRSESLYNSVNSFMDGYYSCTKIICTQFPFPLVQMARTFLLFYIFTVPFALLSDVSSPYCHLLVIFMLTFGYIGLGTHCIRSAMKCCPRYSLMFKYHVLSSFRDCGNGIGRSLWR